MKRTWNTFNKIIASKKPSETLFPKWLVVNDLEIFESDNFIKFFLVKLDLSLHLKYPIR